MTHPDLISEEQLNALIDHELDTEESARVLAAMERIPALRARYNQLRCLKSLVATAYRDVYIPEPNIHKRRHPAKHYILGVASAASILLGIFVGWSINVYMREAPDLNFQYVEKLDTSAIHGNKILLHINTDEPKRVQTSLQWAENLLNYSRTNHTNVELEIVVNADGLNILRTESPYADKIATMTKEFENIKFLACGMAKQNAMFREKKVITLLPEARDIPAALEQIVNRLQEGWIYLRG